MRIALAIRSLALGGGAEHDVVNLSAGLKQAGHEPIVITSGGRLCADLEAGGVRVVPCPLATRSLIEVRRNGRRLAEILERHEVDVLNPQSVFPGLSGAVAVRRLRARGRQVPNVVTIHMLNRPTRWYYRLGCWLLNRSADQVIVESEWELGRLRGSGLKRPASVLYNCVPPPEPAERARTRQQVRGELGWAAGTVVFLMPARLSFEKGHDVLLEALARPAAREAPARFYLAGDGPLLERCRAEVRARGLADRVAFWGFRRDLPELYRAADVFVLCSRWESLPLSVREAMAAPLPILATRVGGLAEAVEHGRSGLLVPPEDPAALADAIATLAADAELRTQMAARGRQIAAEKFDYDRWIARTVEVMSAAKDRLG